MGLPFTRDQFFGVFASYNADVWPAQVLLIALALLAAAVAGARRGRPDWLVPAILAATWLWAGVAYHWAHFRAINPAASLFAGVFVAQAGLFTVSAFRGTLRFQVTAGRRRLTGWILVAYALVVYPIWGLLAGHAPEALPVFGVPCPTTIWTLGVLFWADGGTPRYLLPIPLLWAAIGGSAAFALGVPQDLGLLVSGLLGLALLRRPGGR